METRFLKTFLNVVELTSVAAAARMESLTPSAVVQRIRALEADVGAVLLRRSGHSTRPTEAGVAILEMARKLIEGTESLKAIATRNEEVGTIRVGVIHSMITGLLPEILTAMKETRPGILVEVQPGQSVDLYQKVLDGTLDAAILVEPPFAISKEHVWRELRRDRLIVLTSSTEQETDVLTILRQAPFIRYDRKHWGGRTVESYLRREKLSLLDRYELDSLEAIVVLVGRGLGVSLIPDWLPPWPEGLQLRKIAVDGAPTRNVGVIYRQLSSKDRLVEAFSQEACKAAKAKELTLRL
ncbi:MULTISPECIES: LysR substrate-binding domain-containing protein [Rhizobium]|uniref:LysR substrate-binding domain-containing protein n=1 Tax=Rhizobium TaxID=379 RepID=UPI001C933692|nr:MULTISPECIES: LysR substrate-binding domain-containing protein [Rhizobium]MBY4618502.1 LysR family transcriptional regulator [Rhizobium redzepovicii]ULJ83056.1 LysR substrate-binding domain-containing protein [Rhizobium sp. C104]